MSGGDEKLVRFLSVVLKTRETQESLKAKVLKSISNSEKITPTSVSQSQTWNEESHTLGDLVSQDVVMVASNSSFVTFLLVSGTVCRLPMSSREEFHSSKTFTNLNALRQSATASSHASFQVLGDEEYAQQLQMELNDNNTASDSGWYQGRDHGRVTLAAPLGPIDFDMEDIMADQLMDPEPNPLLLPTSFFSSAAIPYPEDIYPVPDGWR